MKDRRYRVSWIGQYDGPLMGLRVLTMRAKNKVEAGRLHSVLFPSKSRKIEWLRR
jgi:hypothetical protein